jgi:hypothetical protein
MISYKSSYKEMPYLLINDLIVYVNNYIREQVREVVRQILDKDIHLKELPFYLL